MATKDVSIADANPQIAQLVACTDTPTVSGSAAAMLYRAHVDRVIHGAAVSLTGQASVGVKLNGGQVNAALQLLQQVKYKLYDAITLGEMEQKK